MTSNSHRGQRKITMNQPHHEPDAKKSPRPNTFLYLCASVFICGFICLLCAASTPAQDWFKTGTGLGVSKARVAVADFASKDSTAQPLAVLFTDVVRSDLDFSGILELVSKSYNPLQTPATPAEVDYKGWSSAPPSRRWQIRYTIEVPMMRAFTVAGA